MDALLSIVDRRAAGYASREYAASLAEFGAPVELPACGGWLLARPIAGADALDGMGPYPLFACQHWSALGADLPALAPRLVCASLVTEPFAGASPAVLHAAFPDMCYEYKQHYVVDLSRRGNAGLPSHHRRHIRKAAAHLEVRRAPLDAALLAQWQTLYDNLVRRHAIAGVARFSPRAFALQAQVPGLTALAAYERDALCGMTLWYEAGDVAYYHLAAYSARGYELGASYALFSTALAEFARRGLAWAALGAGAGANAVDSGLTRFKQGWANDVRPVYFCGRILQPARYAELTGPRAPGSNYFPAYRAA